MSTHEEENENKLNMESIARCKFGWDHIQTAETQEPIKLFVNSLRNWNHYQRAVD